MSISGCLASAEVYRTSDLQASDADGGEAKDQHVICFDTSQELRGHKACAYSNDSSGYESKRSMYSIVSLVLLEAADQVSVAHVVSH